MPKRNPLIIIIVASIIAGLATVFLLVRCVTETEPTPDLTGMHVHQASKPKPPIVVTPDDKDGGDTVFIQGDRVYLRMQHTVDSNGEPCIEVTPKEDSPCVPVKEALAILRRARNMEPRDGGAARDGGRVHGLPVYTGGLEAYQRFVHEHEIAYYTPEPCDWACTQLVRYNCDEGFAGWNDDYSPHCTDLCVADARSFKPKINVRCILSATDADDIRACGATCTAHNLKYIGP